jgi:NTE family protein
MAGPQRGHRPFVLVLGGGGVRGFTHVGVLRYLESLGYRPSAVVGVSMGAIVGSTYTLREDWYEALLAMETSQLPTPVKSWKEGRGLTEKLHSVVETARAIWDVTMKWGVGERAIEAGLRVLRGLYGNHRLEDGRIPIAVCSTDLISGERVVTRHGSAVNEVYASAALAGVLPPLKRSGRLLADGAYSDIAPIDVAREFGEIVVAVDPSQVTRAPDIEHGYQAIMRATEICFLHHAHLRFSGADLVLRPSFPRYIDTLDFAAMRMCVAAGMRAVRNRRAEIGRLLDGVPESVSPQTSIPPAESRL